MIRISFRVLPVFLMISGLGFLPVTAQTVEEIIRKYSDSIGGLDAINKMETAVFTGTLNSQGRSYPMSIRIVNGKQSRTDVEVNGQIVSNVYDKGTAWKLNPFENITTPTRITAPADIAPLKIQSSLANNLMDFTKRGHTVSLLGQELVDSIPTFKISLTSKDDGKQTLYYISSKDYKLVRTDAKQKIQANEFDAQTYYSGWMVINGISFSTHFVRKIEGKIFQEVKYDRVQLNVPLDEKIFEFPNK